MAEKDAIIIPVTLLVEGNGESGGDSGTEESAAVKTSKTYNDAEKAQKHAEKQAAAAKNMAKALAISTAKKAASAVIGGMGDITGSYVAAENTQLIVGEVMETAAGAVFSYAAGNWAGLAIYAVGKGIEYGTKGYEYQSNLKKSARESEFKQKRVYGTTEKS